MEGRGVKRAHIQDGPQGWYRLRLRNRGKRGKMVVTEMAGGTGTIGMGEEMVVGIGGAIGLAAGGVGLAVEGFTVVEEEGIEIDRLSLWSFYLSVDWAFLLLQLLREEGGVDNFAMIGYCTSSGFVF